MDPVHGGGPWTRGPCFVLSHIYQSLDVRDENRASLELKHRLDRQGPIWEAF